MLTGRRPDTTRVGTGGQGGWCWCERTGCQADALFMTLPTYFRDHGFVTAGNGKLFHPDACQHFGTGVIDPQGTDVPPNLADWHPRGHPLSTL